MKDKEARRLTADLAARVQGVEQLQYQIEQAINGLHVEVADLQTANEKLSKELTWEREFVLTLVSGLARSGVIDSTYSSVWCERPAISSTNIGVKVDLLLDHLGLKVEHVNAHDKLVEVEDDRKTEE